ncbi:MAG: type IV pilus modification protein PilV [Magnetococcales bacterium]|nr:type IV pilus modification protein PilV [Magnetococcales bacterium]
MRSSMTFIPATGQQASIQHHHGGYFMIEVLIALFVFSVGFLGLAGLQLKSLQANRQIAFRDAASAIAQELAERMHANPTAALGGEYAKTYPGITCNTGNISLDPVTGTAIFTNIGDGTSAPYCSDFGAIGASSCTTVQMAQFDRYDLYCNAVNNLPSLTISSVCNDLVPTTSSTHQIVVSWQKMPGETVTSLASCPANLQCLVFNLVP